MPYIGNQPGTGVRNRFIYTATASQTTFSGADNNGKTLKYADSDFVDVFLNGVCLVPVTDYTSTSKTSIVLVQAASLNDTLEVIAYDIATISDTVSKADGGTFEANVTFADGADIITASKGTDNVRLGENAGDSIASGGNYNVTIGKDAGTAITTGDGNVAVGFEALKTEDANGKNIAIGYQALKTLDVGSDGFNTVIGYQAGTSMTTGIVNTLIGHQAGDALTTGNNNIAIGHEALGSEVQGDMSTAIGVGALQNQANSSDADIMNTAVGYNAGLSITTGAENTIMGGEAGDALTVGNSNVAIGVQALSSDQNGSRSTAVGATALKTQEATGSTSNNFYNTGVGYAAGISITEGYYHTLVGGLAGNSMTTGIGNTCVGYDAGDDITTDCEYNVCIGYNAGDGLISDGDNNVFVGKSTTTNTSSSDYQIVLGAGVDSVGDEYTTLGNNSRGRVYNNFSSNASWTRTSDERIKKDIETNTDCGLAFINDLRTVTYKWKAPSEHPEEFKSYDADLTEASYTKKMYGFIAQEVKAAMDTHNITDFSGWHVTPESQGSQQGVSYEMFVMPLVKAVQELSAKVDALETENTAIKARLDALEAE